jgi:hypothetical protein
MCLLVQGERKKSRFVEIDRATEMGCNRWREASCAMLTSEGDDDDCEILKGRGAYEIQVIDLHVPSLSANCASATEPPRMLHLLNPKDK